MWDEISHKKLPSLNYVVAEIRTLNESLLAGETTLTPLLRLICKGYQKFTILSDLNSANIFI